MKSKNLFFKIYIPFLVICIVVLITLSILGKKTRVGYLGDIKFDKNNIERTLELNGLTDIKENYIIDGKLDEEAIKKFIFTNELITNYSYGVKLQYYDKVFRHSDIFGVYIDTNKVLKDNPFIKEVIMDGNGSPFGGLISDKVINEDKIDDIDYNLKIKSNINYYFFWLMFFPLLFYFLVKYLRTKINNQKANNIRSFLYSNSKKYSFIIALIFFILMFFSEIRLFKNEINLEFFYECYKPESFTMRSVFLNPYFIENPQLYTNSRINLIKERRNVKYDYSMYSDQLVDSHILGNIYAALKTGKTLYELRSHNFARHAESNTIATYDELNTPTLYTSTPLLITKIIYNLIPKEFRYIDTPEKELKASQAMHNIKIFFIFIHILLYALLVYVIGIRFNLLYAITVFIGVFSFPGTSLIMPMAYKTGIMPPLFPLYIFAFYKIDLNKFKQVLFYIGLAILIFFQWSINHYTSILFQLPIILLTISFYNLYFQTRDIKLESIKSIYNIMLTHIKKFAIQYFLIFIFTLLITLLVIFISYKEMIKLQPENKDRIHNLVWDRSNGVAMKLSLYLFGKYNKSDDDSKWDNLEKYYPTYSLSNFIEHNIYVFNYYFSYPSLYPLWRLDQFFNEKIDKFFYMIFKYFNLYYLSYLIILLNVLIFILYKKKRLYLIIPSLFFIATIIWFIIYSSYSARIATHFHIYSHMILIYFALIYLTYIVYLMNLLFGKNIEEYK